MPRSLKEIIENGEELKALLKTKRSTDGANPWASYLTANWTLWNHVRDK